MNKSRQRNASHSFNPICIAIGKRIVFLREQQGYSQLEFAGKCKKHPQSLERVENGKINTSVEFLEVIAKALGVHIKSLFKF